MDNTLVKSKTYTREQYHQLVESGELREDDRVELIEGEIVPMSPIGSAHAALVNRLNRLFVERCSHKSIVSIQNPIALDEMTEPQPDIVLLQLRDDFYAESIPHPTDVQLIVEVMVTSHEHDLNTKRELYARHGIAEVWFVDVPGRLVHVCREPQADGRYHSTEVNSGQHPLRPEFAPSLQFDLIDILGPVAKPS